MFGPLKGIKVLEFEGLAPTVFTGMMLADFGADVTIVHRQVSTNPVGIDSHNTFLNRGKRSITADLKNPFHLNIIKQMMSKADVAIDCFRPGKLENIGLGPSQINNPRLIFARLTGFGQTGPLKDLAGHDINYLSYSGILGTFGTDQECPSPPNNILADFAGGGAFGMLGVAMALFERERTGKGQVVDVSMTDCVGYMSSFLLNMKKLGYWNKPRGENLLDGGAPFYNTYKCKDGKFLAVGSIEKEFYLRFLKGLGLENQDVLAKKQYKLNEYNQMKEQFSKKILEKTRDEWMEIFLPLDCCVSPVLDMSEMQNTQQVQKFIYKESDQPHAFQYSPQPQLSLHPELGYKKAAPNRGQHTVKLLEEYGISEGDIAKFTDIQQQQS